MNAWDHSERPNTISEQIKNDLLAHCKQLNPHIILYDLANELFDGTYNPKNVILDIAEIIVQCEIIIFLINL